MTTIESDLLPNELISTAQLEAAFNVVGRVPYPVTLVNGVHIALPEPPLELVTEGVEQEIPSLIEEQAIVQCRPDLYAQRNPARMVNVEQLTEATTTAAQFEFTTTVATILNNALTFGEPELKATLKMDDKEVDYTRATLQQILESANTFIAKVGDEKLWSNIIDSNGDQIEATRRIRELATEMQDWEKLNEIPVLSEPLKITFTSNTPSLYRLPIEGYVNQNRNSISVGENNKLFATSAEQGSTGHALAEYKNEAGTEYYFVARGGGAGWIKKSDIAIGEISETVEIKRKIIASSEPVFVTGTGKVLLQGSVVHEKDGRTFIAGRSDEGTIVDIELRETSPFTAIKPAEIKPADLVQMLGGDTLWMWGHADCATMLAELYGEGRAKYSGDVLDKLVEQLSNLRIVGNRYQSDTNKHLNNYFTDLSGIQKEPGVYIVDYYNEGGNGKNSSNHIEVAVVDQNGNIKLVGRGYMFRSEDDKIDPIEGRTDYAFGPSIRDGSAIEKMMAATPNRRFRFIKITQ